MIYPRFDEFSKLAERGNLIPVYREVLADTETPVSAYMKLGRSPSFLLESVEGGEKWARYSFIGIDPSKVIRTAGDSVEIRDASGEVTTVRTADPLDVLQRELDRYHPVAVPGLPRFFGGLVGYLGYDMVRTFERVPDMGKPTFEMPDMWFLLADTILVFDSLRQKIKIVKNVYTEGRDLAAAYGEAVERLEELVRQLRSAPMPAMGEPTEEMEASEFQSAFGSREDFMRATERSKQYVLSGDVVQVVLSQRFQRKCAANPVNIYRALRVINPSPYMYYIDTGDGKIIGSSPEILVRVEDADIVLRPIAGTRRRGRNDEEDRALEEELRTDPKEQAEHIMLVDLGRNDVGRVAATGSVQVTDLMVVERYSHVMHLVSNVSGRLRQGADPFDVVRACFPAGTVTGAPKVRAMEIIEELEPGRRGPYAGAVGYFSFSKNTDMCITIRTMIYKDETIYVQAGAGIVADSDPLREYQETVNKAMGMFKAVEMAERGFD